MATFNGRRYDNRQFLAVLAARDKARRDDLARRMFGDRGKAGDPARIEAKLDELLAFLKKQPGDNNTQA